MDWLTVATASGGETVRERLDREFDCLRQEGIDVSIAQSTQGSMTFLRCQADLAHSEPSGQVFRYNVASALADLILEVWESDLLAQLAKSQYPELEESERQRITERAVKWLEETQDPIARISRRTEILCRILEYLDSQDHLTIDGFVRFRLQEYKNELLRALDRALEDMLLDQEYQEFIGLLRHFVEIQEARYPLLHAIIRPDGVYRLLDEQREVVENEYLEGFLVELVQSEVDYEDLLVSALISLSPKRIILHFTERPVTETLRDVFGSERVEICSGCDLEGEVPKKGNPS